MPEIKVVLEEEIKKRKLKLKETWKYILMTGLQVLEKRKGINNKRRE